MLVLSRKEGERLVIGDRAVVLTVVAIRGNVVRIGVQADGQTILREEVALRDSRQRRAQSGEPGQPDERAEAA